MVMNHQYISILHIIVEFIFQCIVMLRKKYGSYFEVGSWKRRQKPTTCNAVVGIRKGFENDFDPSSARFVW